MKKVSVVLHARLQYVTSEWIYTKEKLSIGRSLSFATHYIPTRNNEQNTGIGPPTYLRQWKLPKQHQRGNNKPNSTGLANSLRSLKALQKQDTTEKIGSASRHNHDITSYEVEHEFWQTEVDRGEQRLTHSIYPTIPLACQTYCSSGGTSGKRIRGKNI